jgi:hypothetical protein
MLIDFWRNSIKCLSVKQIMFSVATHVPIMSYVTFNDTLSKFVRFNWLNSLLHKEHYIMGVGGFGKCIETI